MKAAPLAMSLAVWVLIIWMLAWMATQLSGCTQVTEPHLSPTFAAHASDTDRQQLAACVICHNYHSSHDRAALQP